VKGRSLESRGWSLESSQRAKRVSIRSNISSISASDFADVPEVDDDSAISCSFSNQENEAQKMRSTKRCVGHAFYTERVRVPPFSSQVQRRKYRGAPHGLLRHSCSRSGLLRPNLRP
jgi:hypothetical protein